MFVNFGFYFLFIFYFAVVSRRLNAFSHPRKQNAKHAKRLKYHAVSEIGRGTLLSVVAPSRARMGVLVITMNKGKLQHAAQGFLYL
jgi:low temperature requirement protein LtrA